VEDEVAEETGAHVLRPKGVVVERAEPERFGHSWLGRQPWRHDDGQSDEFSMMDPEGWALCR
jgi:hypothetical protein